MSVGEVEKKTQERIINLFINELKYTYLGDFTDKQNSNIELKYLIKFLQRQGYSDVLIKRGIKVLQDKATNQQLSLYDLNKETYAILRYGAKVKEGAGEQTRTVNFVDWEHPLNNDFYIAEEVSVSISNNSTTKRPDIVLYINGIAFGVIELKRSTVSMAEGIRQNLTNQKKEMIRHFFATIGLVMAGNDAQGLKYGVINTSEKYYLAWKEDKDATDEISKVVRKIIDKYPIRLDKNLISLCKKERLIEILYNFMIFDSGTKKTCRPNQYFGNLAARSFVRKHAGGVIWHTQGSGKSLTMVWFSKWIKENISNSRILIVTDRDELDEQIEGVFTGVDEKIVRTTSGKDLVSKINDTSPVLMCSLVHKFGRRGGSATEADYASFMEELMASLPPNFSPKGDFYVFVDECHRTQSGKLHKAMKTILPNALLIGFTGTPLMKKDKQKSIEVFGPYIHRYKFDEAVKDGVVLDLRYEAREVEQNVISQERIDAWFDSKTAGLSETAKAQLKLRWGSLQKMFSSKSRLSVIVSDIMFDMEMKPRLKSGRGNAMLVAGSIYQACKYYELFQSAGLKKCAVVTSYEPNIGDIRTETVGEDGETEAVEQYEIYRKMLDGKDPATFEKEVKRKFIEEPDEMKLLIVVDKLLTGFDAPPATFLYIDKSMRDHGLFQAICRVNRLDGTDKDFGYIIDYKDLFRSLEKAVADYTAEAFAEYDAEDISGLLTDRFDKAKDQLEDVLESLYALCEPVEPPKNDVDYIHYFCGKNTEQFDVEELEANMPKREQLYDLSASALRSFAEVSGELQERYHYSLSQIKKLESEVSNFIKIRDVVRAASGDYIDLKAYDPDMRHLIDNYLSANPSTILTSFNDMSIVQLLVDRGIDALSGMPSETKEQQEALAETIENNVQKEIVEKSHSNPKYYEKMSALLKELVEKRKQDVLNYQQYLQEIIELAKKVQKPETNMSYPEAIRTSPACRALYDNLDSDESLTMQVHEAVMEYRTDGFRGNVVKERQIKRQLARVLGVFCKINERNESELVEKVFSIVKEQDEY